MLHIRAAAPRVNLGFASLVSSQLQEVSFSKECRMLCSSCLWLSFCLSVLSRVLSVKERQSDPEALLLGHRLDEIRAYLHITNRSKERKATRIAMVAGE